MLNKDQIKKVIEKAPSQPGIYKMSDENDKVIYIGKAKDLKKRLKQYFQKGYSHSTRTAKLLENLAHINVISVDSELEAIILENNLIKQFNPKYNILLKDDKGFVYIKITKEDFPRIQIVRQIEKDDAKYIGPKTAQHKVQATLKLLKKIFPYRHCNLGIDFIETGKEKHKVKITNKIIKYPCLDYYIKRCVAPCIGLSTPEEYREIIENIESFLEGKGDNLLKSIREKIMAFAEKKEFEKAARLRDKMLKIESILKTQKVSDPNQTDKDIINYCILHGSAYFNLFQIRDGKLIGQENFILTSNDLGEDENTEVLKAFLEQYYTLATDIPTEILLPHEPEDSKIIQEQISETKGRKVKITIPQIGIKNRLLEMSAKNARIYADKNKPSWRDESEITKLAVNELQKILKLDSPPKRIECYDISHLSGTDTVGSMIVFKNGVPKNDHYRLFKLRTVEGKPDDYKSMEEVLTRRLSKIAQNYHLKDYKIKKLRKKDHENLDKALKIKDPHSSSYLAWKNEKEIMGYGELHERSEKVSEISNLQVAKNSEQTLKEWLLKVIIKKAKAKRIYVACEEKDREFFLVAGFEETKKHPKELTPEKSQKVLVYDKNKHQPDKSYSEIPDLLLIDGGKGQLAQATQVLKKLKLKIPHVSLAKRLEEIYTPTSNQPILLARTSPALKLAQAARDEAHRFAITFNKKLRTKRLHNNEK